MATPQKNQSVLSDGIRLLRFLSRHKDSLAPLLILTHDYPDPDSLASAFALKHLAEDHFGIQSDIAFRGVIGRTENREMVRRLRVPIRRLKPSDFRRAHIALVDTQPGFRNNPFPADRKATLVIDQHRPSGKPNAELSLVNLGCGATSVILAQALLMQRRPVPPRVATSLVYGILTDTQNLNRTHDPVVVKTYLKLLPFCDMKELAAIQSPPRSRRFFTTLGYGIREAMLCRDVLIVHLRDVENPDLVSQTADFFLHYKKTKVSFCTGRYNGRLYMSLRTIRPSLEAGEVLRDVCGDRASAGGHGPIAGGSFEVGAATPEAAWKAEEQALLVRLLDRLRVSRLRPITFPFRAETTSINEPTERTES